MKKIQPLQKGDSIGVIAPSRPVYNHQKDLNKTINFLQKHGFKIVLSKNLSARNYYRAGTVKERLSDLHSMFKNQEIKAIICATGGASSNQLIEGIDYELIKNNPKIFWGYSDITALLLAIYKKTRMITFHGPDMTEIANLTSTAQRFFLDFVQGCKDNYVYPKQMKVIKAGKAHGQLLGGNITLVDSVLASKYCPPFSNKIFFWEEIGESPAMLHFKLEEFKLSGQLKKISAMIIGNLSSCRDKKYPRDNRKIEDIVMELTGELSFPIVKLNYFGHDLKNFYPFPIGGRVNLDTRKKEFCLETPFIKKPDNTK